jgi:hypothetical protein
MVRIVLDCKIEFPDINDKVTTAINTEITKDLKIVRENLADKVSELIKKYSQIKIHNEAI